MPNKKKSGKIRVLNNITKKNQDTKTKSKIPLILLLLFFGAIIILLFYIQYKPKMTGFAVCVVDGFCNSPIEDYFNCPTDCLPACPNAVCEVPAEYSCGGAACVADCGACGTIALSITYPSNNQYVPSSSITVTGTSNNTNEVRIKLNLDPDSRVCFGAVGTCNSWNKILFLNLGSNTIEVSASNGGELIPYLSRTVYYDPTPPTITINSPSNASNVSSSPININGVASDNVNLNKVELRVNGKTWELASGTTYWNRGMYLDSGINYIEARATDGAGNTQIAAITLYYNVPPIPTNLIANTISTTQINLSWTDVDSELDYYIERSSDGINFALIDVVNANIISYSSTGLTVNTQYWYRIKAHNNAGNSSYSGIATATTFAVPPPSVTLITPLDNKISQSPVSFSCSSSNTDLVSMSLYGQWNTGWHLEETQSCTLGQACSINFINKPISDGTYNWNCQACTLEVCGFAIFNRTIIIDTTNPVVSFIDPTPLNDEFVTRTWINMYVSVTELNEANITFNLYDSNSIRINSTTFFTSFDRSIAFINLSYGNYSYDVVVIDRANNIGSTERRIIRLQEPVPVPGAPNITFVYPTPDNFKSQSETSAIINVTVNDTVSEIKNCTLRWNNANFSMTKVGSGLNVSCYLQKTSLLPGSYIYSVYSTNSQNITGMSEERLLHVVGEDITTGEPVFELLTTVISGSNFVNESILSLIEISTGTSEPITVGLSYIIMDENEMPFYKENDNIKITGGLIINKWFTAPAENGNYRLRVILDYKNLEKESEDRFSVGSRIIPKIEPSIWNVIISVIIIIAIVFGLRLLGPIGALHEKKKKSNSSENNKSDTSSEKKSS
ncbi:MAG: Ig-like domain-containing protein [Nanoarchaeota archaeon]